MAYPNEPGEPAEQPGNADLKPVVQRRNAELKLATKVAGPATQLNQAGTVMQWKVGGSAM